MFGRSRLCQQEPHQCEHDRDRADRVFAPLDEGIPLAAVTFDIRFGRLHVVPPPFRCPQGRPHRISAGDPPVKPAGAGSWAATGLRSCACRRASAICTCGAAGPPPEVVLSFTHVPAPPPAPPPPRAFLVPPGW